MECFDLKRIPLEGNVCCQQKCYLSEHVFKKINQSFCPRVYALLALSSKCKCICRLGLEKDLHSSFIKFNDSVVSYKECQQTKDGFPCEPLDRNIERVNIEEIGIVQIVNSVKSVSVSVVFTDVKAIKKWKNNSSNLSNIVKSILQLYVISDCSVVFLDNLEAQQRLGIHCLVVHRMSTFGSVESILGRVCSSTKVSTFKLLSQLRFELKQNVQNSLELGGLSKPYQALKEIIESQSLRSKGKGLQPPQQVLLIGPSGCGKTSLVQKIAGDCGAILVSILGPELYHPKPGDTEDALRRVFQEASDLADEGLTVLLLDEVDSICLKREKAGSSYTARATSQLLSLLEKVGETPNLVVIATTNRVHDIDTAIRRPGRLEIEIYIGVPTEKQRKEILYILTRPMLSLDFEYTAELCEAVANMTPGYVGADLSLLCQDVAFLQLKKQENSKFSELEDWLEYFHRALSRIRPSSLRSGLGVVTTHPVNLSDIGGLDDVKKTLEMAVKWPLLHPEAFARLGLPQPHGVLMYGPPGCAKTRLACALATATNTTFLATSAAELYSPFVGDAEKSVVELFHRARLGAPAILFIDEIDALLGSRCGREKGVHERVLSTFLTEMDGVGLSLDGAMSVHSRSDCYKEGGITCPGILVIAATNRPDILDDALLRPGRFDKLIYVPPPDALGRLDILRIYLAKTPLAPCVNLQEIAAFTEYFSGADIKNLCREAALHALAEDGMGVADVKHKDFLWAIDSVRPSLTKSQIQWYNNFNISSKR
ncbi:Transitional endoplasmic reticulum ATPase TER94 [Gryllus bimaculatus]|nr:Transitional endoplasmic reticulum ATPase TER94 [Gryllus bimaculatus]